MAGNKGGKMTMDFLKGYAGIAAKNGDKIDRWEFRQIAKYAGKLSPDCREVFMRAMLCSAVSRENFRAFCDFHLRGDK
jgi:hypothetical protein